MGRFVIVAYKAKAGKERALEALVAQHLAVLAAERFTTDRPASVMRAADGTIVEVFEWASPDAIARAHAHPAVAALWAEFAAACDYRPLATLAEASNLFAEFDAVRPGP